MRSIFTIVLIALSNFLLAQNGKITGKIINLRTGDPLIGATINVEGTSRTVTSDLNGNYSISGLVPKTYGLLVSYISYTKKIVEDVVLKAGEVLVVNISLEEAKNTSVDVVVTRTRVTRENTASLLTAQKNSASVSDGISAEIIRKTPDRTTSDVLKRVSGASIQDDRFAIIRGLNDRYNAAFINGAPLPSSESDRKAFAFDIFPSNILDNLVIYKTATPDMNGEFAGGLINITTKSIPAKSFTSISIGTGYNSLATFKERKYSETKGKWDFLGFDDGARALPKAVAESKSFFLLTNVEKANMAKEFGNYKWGLLTDNASPNFNFQLVKGMNFEKNGKELGTLFSISYSKSNSFTSGERNSYDYDVTSNGAFPPVWKGKYMDSTYNVETLVGALANFSFKLNAKNNFSWKNTFSINADNKIITRYGNSDVEVDPDFKIRDAVRIFTSNQIYTSQLNGEHLLTKNKLKLDWLASYGNVKREIPHLGRTSYAGYEPDLSASVSNGTLSQSTGSGTMFFTSSNENIKNLKADFTQPYTLFKNKQQLLKAGVNYQKRDRAFAAQFFGFLAINRNPNPFDFDLLKLSENKIFEPQNLGIMANNKAGFSLGDGRSPSFIYDATSELTSGYIMNDQRFFNKLRFIYGARIENFNQKLNTYKSDSKPTNINTTILDVLPSANLIYSLNNKMNVRLSYSQTINRPEFRELAPYLFYDFATQYTYEGFDSLTRAKITNYDFRYEFYPGRSQLISISAFYKDFDNPIEIITNPIFDNLAIYNNSKSAKVYGAEIEFRTLLSFLAGASETSFLNDFTWSANAAYTKSEVVLGRFGFLDPSLLVTDRALQGQSPYIINSSLGYNNEKSGFSSTVSVNRVGDRIFIAGAVQKADIYERARTVLDFQIAKTFLKDKLEIKLNARDILAQNLAFYFDYDKSKDYTPDIDKFFSNAISPKVITLNISYKL